MTKVGAAWVRQLMRRGTSYFFLHVSAIVLHRCPSYERNMVFLSSQFLFSEVSMIYSTCGLLIQAAEQLRDNVGVRCCLTYSTSWPYDADLLLSPSHPILHSTPAMWIVDMIQTVPQEIDAIWSRKLNSTSALYFMNRYGTLLSLSLQWITTHRGEGSDRQWVLFLIKCSILR